VSDCDPAGRARRVAEVFIGDQMAEAPEAPTPEEEPEAPALTEAQAREYMGSYRSPELDSTYDIVIDSEGQLVAEHWRNDPQVLTPTGDDTFVGNPRIFPELRFVRDGSGRITAFTITGVRVRNLIFERQD
jgi:hypothetical protein